MPRDAGTRLKAALLSPKTTLMPGGYSPVIAKMLEKLGFEAMFLRGS